MRVGKRAAKVRRVLIYGVRLVALWSFLFLIFLLLLIFFFPEYLEGEGQILLVRVWLLFVVLFLVTSFIPVVGGMSSAVKGRLLVFLLRVVGIVLLLFLARNIYALHPEILVFVGLQIPFMLVIEGLLLRKGFY